jgi:hypothetical protein
MGAALRTSIERLDRPRLEREQCEVPGAEDRAVLLFYSGGSHGWFSVGCGWSSSLARDAGNQVVAVAPGQWSRPASQIAMEDLFAFLFTIKNGRVVREHPFRNREEAVEAAGLSE